jgi:hypothetical protein
MPAWFRTRVVHGRSMFVELLDDGQHILQPPRADLTADDLSWLDKHVMPELRYERAQYNRAVREHLERCRGYRPPASKR